VYKVVILPHAKQDLRDAKLWYESRVKGLGYRFLNDIKKKIEYIKFNPLASNIKYDKIHTNVLEIFPFMIHYIVENDTTTITIIAVLHTSLDSEKWISRK